MISVAQAVMSLRPGVEWSMDDDDVEKITWHTDNVEPLSRAQVEAEITRLETEAIQQKQQKKQINQLAVAHAKSLGFTDEMIAVMYPTLVEE